MASTIPLQITAVIPIGQTGVHLVGARAIMVQGFMLPIGGLHMVLAWVTAITAAIIPIITGGITIGATAITITTNLTEMAIIQPAMKRVDWSTGDIILITKTTNPEVIMAISIAATPVPLIEAAVPVTEPLIARQVIVLQAIALTAAVNQPKEVANNPRC